MTSGTGRLAQDMCRVGIAPGVIVIWLITAAVGVADVGKLIHNVLC
jgi:hypothetical protein